jgi:hypothetical protein
MAHPYEYTTIVNYFIPPPDRGAYDFAQEQDRLPFVREVREFTRDLLPAMID